MARRTARSAAALAVAALVAACDRAPDTGAPAPAPDPARRAAPPADPARSPAPARPAPTQLLSAAGAYHVAFRTEPDPIPLNELFDVEVLVHRVDAGADPLDGIELAVDGRMPEHRHGMTREPRVERRPDGSFLVTGMLFHMPGRWELHFDVTHDAVTERAQAEVVLE